MWMSGLSGYGYEKVSTASPEGEGLLETEEEVESTMDGRPAVGRLYLLCLTISMGGLQVVWATVMAEGSAFLLSLGLRPYIVSLVWLAGPICGTVLQPYIGYKSDFCTHPWGRRRPFMIYGMCSTILCINLLAWTSEIVRSFAYLLDVKGDGCAAHITTQILAVMGIWALNVAIQPVQTSIRALIVDSCPGEQAAQANSFASTAVIVGSAVGYGCGVVRMPRMAGWVENAEFKGLCLVASVALGCTVAVTALVIEEKTFDGEELGPGREKFGVKGVWMDIFEAIRELPPTIRRVCVVQFFAWLAWFPFLFNIVVYLSKLYGHQILSESTGSSSTIYFQAVGVQSTQHAVMAMLLYSIVALMANLLLPHLISNSPSQASWQGKSISAPTRLSWFTLPRAWMCSHIITSICLFGATLGDCFMSSVVFVALLGISWALTQWAPFAIIMAEIAKSTSTPDPDKIELSLYPSSPSSSNTNHDEETQHLTGTDTFKSPTIRLRAGTTMGVHNIAIAMPQMLSAVLNSAIFWGCRQLGVDERETMAWVLRVGVLAGLGAAVAARGIR
ncbi:MFS sugar transporter-like protein [Cadophora sp. MPI-SDFR-AT-0126]|nr:MFS sugar transporter-like protein [Leotiomycetes sp. MPI-SDFR-AT-0126]